MPDSLQDLARRLEQFANDRDWKQFHSPKNLSSALAVEAAELLENFQ
jgi:dCTP diphosphatase